MCAISHASWVCNRRVISAGVCGMPCHAMPCHAMPCHAMPYHAMPCHAMPCYQCLRTKTPPERRTQRNTSFQNTESGAGEWVASAAGLQGKGWQKRSVFSDTSMPWHGMAWHGMSCHAMSCHVILRCDMLCYVTSCHITPCHVLCSDGICSDVIESVQEFRFAQMWLSPFERF